MYVCVGYIWIMMIFSISMDSLYIFFQNLVRSGLGFIFTFFTLSFWYLSGSNEKKYFGLILLIVIVLVVYRRRRRHTHKNNAFLKSSLNQGKTKQPAADDYFEFDKEQEWWLWTPFVCFFKYHICFFVCLVFVCSDRVGKFIPVIFIPVLFDFFFGVCSVSVLLYSNSSNSNFLTD